MIQEEFKDLVFKFARHASVDDVAYIFLFGSVAKGDADQRSDVDLLVVFDTYGDNYEELKSKTRISELTLTLEKEYDRRIQVVFTNKSYKGLDNYFIEKVFNEGMLIYSEYPTIKIDEFDAAPYSLILFRLDNFESNEKMKIKRLLYGIKTKKIAGKKVYENERIGLAQSLQGIRIGPGAIAIPKKNSKTIANELNKLNVVYKEVDFWITRDGIRRLKN